MTRRLTVGDLRTALAGLDDATDVLVSTAGEAFRNPIDVVDITPLGATLHVEVEFPDGYWGDA